MNILKLKLIVTSIAVFISMISAADQSASSDAALGEKLLREVWKDLKASDIDSLENKMAAGFQSVHTFGAKNKAEELSLIKNLQLGEYVLSDIKITRNDSVIVATYFVSVQETIEGKKLNKKPAARMSIFLETNDGWKWIAHANLKAEN